MKPLKSLFLNNIKILKAMHPLKLVLLGYLSYILIGWMLLSLPFAQLISTHAIDNLFTATSAVSTTGLVTVSTSDNYSFFGELVILVLIQLGGLGYMTFGSFVILSGKRQLSPVREKISSSVFVLPKNFKVDKFIKSVVRFTITIELTGAILLFFIFKTENIPNAAWSAVFHSISAFCTAGFSI